MPRPEIGQPRFTFIRRPEIRTGLPSHTEFNPRTMNKIENGGMMKTRPMPAKNRNLLIFLTNVKIIPTGSHRVQDLFYKGFTFTRLYASRPIPQSSSDCRTMYFQNHFNWPHTSHLTTPRARPRQHMLSKDDVKTWNERREDVKPMGKRVAKFLSVLAISGCIDVGGQLMSYICFAITLGNIRGIDYVLWKKIQRRGLQISRAWSWTAWSM